MYSKKRIFILLVLLVFFSTSGGILSAGKSSNVKEERGGKIGFVDFLIIYHSYSQTKVEDERLKEKGNELQAKIDLEREKIAELEKKMDSGVLSEKEKEKLSKEIEDAKTQAQSKIQEFNLEINNDRKKTIDKLIEELKDKISRFGKENDYIMILDKNEPIFSDTSLDLTKEIVDYINKDAEK
jgi:outer membrane protein